MLTPPDLEKVIHAFIFSRLDYCNALLSGLNQKPLSRLQLVQNSAARLLNGFNRRHHITPISASLHLLPVCLRIDFKILLITFKAQSGLAPSYIKDILIPYEPARSLRSSDRALLTIPKSRLKTKWDRVFAIRAPRLWNALPEEIRLAGSVNSFESLLKKHFYRLSFMCCGPFMFIFTPSVLSSVLLFLLILFISVLLSFIITSVISAISCNLFYRRL